MRQESREILQRKFGELLSEWDPEGPLMEVTVFFKKDGESALAVTLSVVSDDVGLEEVPRGRLEEVPFV